MKEAQPSVTASGILTIPPEPGRDRMSNNVQTLLANLSPVKRAMLELRLNKRGQGDFRQQTICRLPRNDQPACFPLSFAQERLWFLNQLDPNSPAYNMAGAVRVKGLLKLKILERSVAELIQRHEVLRTTFQLKGGHLVQMIHPVQAFKIDITEVAVVKLAEREQELKEMLQEETTRPFDLANGPLIRVKLVRLALEEHLLVYTLHHIVCDGWSLAIVMREFAQIYNAFCSGKQCTFPDLQIQYADFAVWERQWLQGEVLDAQLSYWKEQLKEAPTMLPLPTDRSQSTVQTCWGGKEQLVLSRSLTDGLKNLSQLRRVTLFMTMLAGFGSLLHTYSGYEDIVVGTRIARRSQKELEGLIGFFVNTLVLRNDLSGNPSFLELLDRVRGVASEAYKHQGLPFERLVQELKPDRRFGPNLLFRVVVTMDNVETDVVQLPGLIFEFVEIELTPIRADLMLSLRETAQGLAVDLIYDRGLFTVYTANRILRHLQEVFEKVVAQPDIRLSAIKQILAERDEQQTIVQKEKFKMARSQQMKQPARKTLRGKPCQ